MNGYFLTRPEKNSPKSSAEQQISIPLSPVIRHEPALINFTGAVLKDFTIFIPLFVCLFWTVFFFLNRKRSSRSQHIWMIVTALLSVSFGVTVFYWYSSENYGLFYKLDIIEAFTTLLFIPVILLYFRKVTGDDQKLSVLKILLLFFPSAFCGGVTAFCYLRAGDLHSTEYSRVMIENLGEILPENDPFYHIRGFLNEYTYSLLFLIQAVSVLIYAVRRLYLYRNRLENFFSDVDARDINRHWAVLWGVMILLLLFVVISASGYMMYVGYDVWVTLTYWFLGALLYYICYNVQLSHYTAEVFEQDLVLADTVEQKQGYMDSAPYAGLLLREKILPELTRLMEEEKLFLKNDLRLDELAQTMQTNRTYISRLIHEEFGCNFSEYINGIRISYAKEIAGQNPHFTQEYIASASGFTNPFTFSRTFKRQAGMTFREWQNRL